MRRIALMGASLALLAGMTAACGGAPDDASVEEFCDALDATSTAQDFDALQDAVAELSDVGTPEEIPDDARDGFETYVDAVSDSDSFDDLKEKAEDLDADEEKADDAFSEYVDDTCTD